MFPGLDGGATDGNNKFFPFPQTLAPGQSVAFRVHIGFIPTQTVQQKLRDMYAKSGPVHYQPAFAALAREGVTLYGGKAEYKELPEDGGVIISIDPSSYKSDPVYKISFTSGRGNVWQIVTAETAAKLQQITP